PAPDCPSSAVQRSAPRDVAGIDKAATRKSREVAAHIENFDVSALGFKFCERTSTGKLAYFGTADTSGKDISALSFQAGGAADIARSYVAGLGADYHAVIARYGYFELHTKMRGGRARGMRMQRTGNYDFTRGG